MEAGKGDLEGNLARHLALLEEAADERCHLAVFPELSLTGSIDPRRRPGAAITAESEAVKALARATQTTGVAALFGLAEEGENGDHHITQIYAHSGVVAGRYRKRHLGEDEEGYTPGTAPGLFWLGAARFGVAICAEGAIELPWHEAAAAGAGLVLFCAAPGLYGRRTDQAGWSAGHSWWEEEGLAQVRGHARTYGIWVGMATQAGSTADEDFPGLAALVDPAGEVVARLPDWRPGTLVVDVPIPIEAEPVRESARVLVIDQAGRVLLVRFEDQEHRATWWCPPGGGLDAGEDHATAARRELLEELGRSDLELGPWIGLRTHTFWFGGAWMTQRERWALCHTTAFEVADSHVAGLRAENVHEIRWWTASELAASSVDRVPRRLVSLLADIAQGRVPAADTDLGV